MTNIYEQRVVLFLDILGFRELVKQGRESLLLNALEIPSELQQGYPFDGGTKMQISAFSDSITISEEVGDGFGIIRLVHYASYLWLKFLAKGVLTRGGIAVGNLRHQNGIIFGPAMNEAYELENQLAIYPRVVISSEIQNRLPIELLRVYKENLAMVNFGWQIMRRDFDGIVHVNTLGHCAACPSECFPPKQPGHHGGISYSELEIFEAKASLVRTVLKERPDSPRIAAKFDWLSNYLADCQAKSAMYQN